MDQANGSSPWFAPNSLPSLSQHGLHGGHTVDEMLDCKYRFTTNSTQWLKVQIKTGNMQGQCIEGKHIGSLVNALIL